MVQMKQDLAADRSEMQRQMELGNSIEEILVSILELEAEWRLDDRIAFAVRQQGVAETGPPAPPLH
jgi:hypothetical protein